MYIVVVEPKTINTIDYLLFLVQLRKCTDLCNGIRSNKLLKTFEKYLRGYCRILGKSEVGC